MGPQKKEVTMSQRSGAPTQPKLSTEDRLLGVLYQFVQLHECWTKNGTKNQEELEGQIQQLEKTIQALSGKVTLFSKLESTIQQQVQSIIRNAGIQIAETVKQETHTLVEQIVFAEVSRLSHTVRNAQSLLEDYSRAYRAQTRWGRWKVVGAAVLSGWVVALVFGVMVVHFMMPASVG